MRCGWWRRWYTLKGKYSLAFLARGGLHHTMGGRAYTRTLKHVPDTYTYTDTDTTTRTRWKRQRHRRWNGGCGSGGGAGGGGEASGIGGAAVVAKRPKM